MITEELKKNLPALAILSLSTFFVCATAAFTQVIAINFKLDFNAIAGNAYQWSFPMFMAGCCASLGLCTGILDRYGRKTPYLIGSIIFLIGTAVCALASDMTVFNIFRFPQGFGAGIVIATGVAQIFFDCSDKKDRYLCNGLLSLGFGGGMLLGVFIGKVAVNSIGWRNFLWIIFILQLLITYPCYKLLRKGECSTMKPDILGSILLMVFGALFVLYFEKLYLDWSFGSFYSLLGLGILIMLVVMYLIEEYMRPHSGASRLVKDRKLMIASLVMIVLLGCIDMASVGWMIKVALFTYQMDILSVAPSFAVIIIGAAITAITASKTIDRTGHMPWFLLSAVLTIVALWSAYFIEANQSSIFMTLHMFLLGLAIGCLVSLVNGTIQNRTDKDSNGAYMSFALMARTCAMWMGYNLYQFIVDGYMVPRLADTVTYWNSITGFNLPRTGMLPCLLVTPLAPFLEIIPGLTTKIGNVFAEGVFLGYFWFGLVFVLISVPVTVFLVGKKKVL